MRRRPLPLLAIYFYLLILGIYYYLLLFTITIYHLLAIYLLPITCYPITCYLFMLVIGVALTCVRPGGGYHPPPLRFFADSEKTAARSAANFAIAVQPTIWHISKKNDDPMTPKVTPPGHIK